MQQSCLTFELSAWEQIAIVGYVYTQGVARIFVDAWT